MCDGNVKPDVGITESCEIPSSGERGKEKEEHCKRFLSGIEVIRVKKSNSKETTDYRRKKNYSNSSSRDPERSDDLAAIFTVREREKAGVRPCSVTRCLKI